MRFNQDEFVGVPAISVLFAGVKTTLEAQVRTAAAVRTCALVRCQVCSLVT
jgi:hypothetical protein